MPDDDLLYRVKSSFEAGVLSHAYQTWFQEAVQMFEFYEGKQFTSDELQMFEALKLKSYVVNLSANRIDGVVGKDVQTRTKIKFTARSNDPDENQLADALTDLAYYVQDKNKSSSVITQAKADSAICGIGWHAYTTKDGNIEEESVNPLEIVWDWRDRTPLMTNQGFVARIHWKDVEEAKLMFPKMADEIESAVTQLPNSVLALASTFNVFSDRMLFAVSSGYYAKDLRQIMLVQYQYRTATKYYTAITKDGKLIATFSRKDAEKLNDKKNGDITEEDGFRVREVWFTGSMLLDDKDLNQFDPKNADYTLTPFVSQREKVTGIPFGLMRRMQDPQRLYNLKNNKLNWKMGTAQVIADKGAVDDIDELATQVAKPDGIVFVNPGKNFKIDRGETQIQQLAAALQAHAAEIQQASGVYDEALGIQTNATSGIAISKRQMASTTTQSWLQDKWSIAKYRVATRLLDIMRSTFTEQMATWIMDEQDEAKLIELNKVMEDGHIYNDVRVGRFDIAIDEIPDVTSKKEEVRENIMQLIQGGMFRNVPAPLWPAMLLAAGIPEDDPIAKSLMSGLQQMQQPQQPIAPTAPQPGAGEMPTGAPGLTPNSNGNLANG